MAERISKIKSEIFKSLNPKRRDDLKISDFDSSEYYQLEDGKILIDLKDGAPHSLLMDSEQEFVNFLRKVSASAKGSYILAGFPNNSAEFLSLAETASSKLEAILNIKNLNYSFSSLRLIDKAIKKSITYEEYFDNVFYWLVPYVCKCIIAEKNAQWKFIFNEDEDTIEPFLRLPGGSEINVFIDLNEEAMEDFQNFSVYGTAQLRLDRLQ